VCVRTSQSVHTATDITVFKSSSGMGRECRAKGVDKKCLQNLLGEPKRKNIRPKMQVRETGLEVWTGFISFKVSTGGGLLYIQQ
jgi:hypothetical protein